MKIKISPSTPEPGYVSVEVDTLCNDENSDEAVAAAMEALRSYGHHPIPMYRAVLQWFQENEPEAISED